MAYPSSSHNVTSASAAHAGGGGLVSGGSTVSQGHHPRIPQATPTSCSRSSEGDHQLEKLEFALAVALTRGDLQRSQQLRQAIADLGGNLEEPGT